MDRSSLWSRLNWPHVALVGLVIAGTLGALGIVLAFTPPAMLEKLLELNWPAVVLGGVSLLIAVYGMLRRAGILHTESVRGLAIEPLSPVDTGLDDEPTHPLGPRAIRRRDTPPGDRGSALAVLLAVGVAAGLGALLTGCGASPLRQHATAARLVMLSVDGAGQAIELAADEQLADCPDADGPERTACIDAVEARMTTAAAARDALIVPAHSYRDVVKSAPEDAPPEALGYLDIVARSVGRDWDPFAEAMRALGVPVPAVDLGGGDDAGE